MLAPSPSENKLRRELEESWEILLVGRNDAERRIIEVRVRTSVHRRIRDVKTFGADQHRVALAQPDGLLDGSVELRLCRVADIREAVWNNAQSLRRPKRVESPT